MTTTANHNDDQIGAHDRAHAVDGAASTADERCQANARSVGERPHERHVDSERLYERRILRRSAKEEPSFVRSTPYHTKRHTTKETKSTQGAGTSVVHEAEVKRSSERVGNSVRLPGRPYPMRNKPWMMRPRPKVKRKV